MSLADDKMTGIFFDIDDTLYSRRALLLQAARDTAKDSAPVCGEAGSPQEDHFMKVFYRFSDENYPFVVAGRITPWQSNVQRYVKTLRHLGADVSKKDGEAFADRYTWLQEHMILTEELHGMMRELSSCPHVRLGVLTNGASKFQWKKFYMLGLEQYIPLENVVVSGDVGVSKPENGIFLIAADRMGLRPEDLWIVGDSVKHDICGAKACGWHTLWLRRNAEASEGAGADLTADTEGEMRRQLAKVAGMK